MCPHKITCSSFITWSNDLNRIMGRISVTATLRLAAYWATFLAGLWSLIFFFVTEKGRDWYRSELADT
jgi:Mg2+ and Co2+ transporter CorA